MSGRDALAAIALAALLVTAGCSAGTTGGSTPTAVPETGTTTPTAQVERPDPDVATVHVEGSGRAQSAPDRAVLRVGVEVFARDAATARLRLARNVTGVRSALREMGIEDSQVTTTDFDIDRRFRRGRGDRRIVGFEARHSLTVTMSDLDRAGEAVVTAVENGATTIRDVEFVLSASTRRQLRDEALSRAMADARREAEVLARQEGLRVTDVRLIRTADTGFVRDAERTVAATATPAPSGGAPTKIDRGKVTVAARVTVVYNSTATG